LMGHSAWTQKISSAFLALTLVLSNYSPTKCNISLVVKQILQSLLFHKGVGGSSRILIRLLPSKNRKSSLHLLSSRISIGALLYRSIRPRACQQMRRVAALKVSSKTSRLWVGPRLHSVEILAAYWNTSGSKKASRTYRT